MDSVKAELHTFIDDPMDPVNNYNMGVKYFLAEQYAAAFSHFMRASERSDDTRFVVRSLLYASKSMGSQGGRDAKELDLIAHALSIGYKYPEVHCIKAMYHSWRKDWTQCYATCCMALELIDTYEVDEPFLYYSGKESILNQKAMAEYHRARYNDSRATYNSILEMDISDWLRRQIQNKMKEFPEPYAEPITCDYNHSQIFQDVFVETVMNKKENGTYLEIGAGNYSFGNNTLMLEEKYGWKGISLEWNKDLVYKFNTNRKNQCICADATKVEYAEILKDLPNTIDYLQLDCDPANVTFEILKRIPFDTHQFNVITYEHDYFNDPTKSFRQKSRDYLTSKGYILAVGDVTADREEQMNFEDWWVHPRVASSCPRIHTQGPICGERYFAANTFKTICDDTCNKNPKVCWGFCSSEKAVQIQKYIKDICHTYDNPVCVEIGVFGGMSCIPVLIELHRAGKGILHAIDPWDNVEATLGYEDIHYDWWKNVDLNKVYTIFKNIISEYNFTKFVNIVKLSSNDAPTIDNINYLYIDGQHTEQAFKDIDKYATNIVEDGILILDDISKESFSMVMKDLPEYAIQLGFKKIDEVGDAFVFKKTITRENAECSSTNIITFGNDLFNNQKIRFKKQAEALEWFDNITIETPDTISDFVEEHSDFFDNNPKGYGYWTWKPYIIERRLSQLKMGDILVYLDCGSSILNQNKEKLDKYVDLLDDKDVIVFDAGDQKFNHFVKMNVVKEFDLLNKPQTLNNTVIEGGCVIIKKTPDSVDFINSWKHYLTVDNYKFVNDELYGEDQLDSFKSSRHDQVILGALARDHKRVHICQGIPELYSNGPLFHSRLTDAGPREFAKPVPSIQPPQHLPTSITIDNFYDDPDEVREYALGLDYQPEENHGAVGFRCEAGGRILPGTKELFETHLGRKIKNWSLGSTNGCFQWCPETTRRVYHSDQTTYAGIIFLTPDAPPEAGLSLCRHKKYKIRDSSIFGKPDWYSPSRGHKEPHTDKTPWEAVDKIGNVYNRLVLFNARHVHAVSEYFGDQIHNSRLFQLFFFDI